jgi:hypothetical protein
MSRDWSPTVASDALNRRELEVRNHLLERAVRDVGTEVASRRRSRLIAWLAFRPYRGILRPAAEQQRSS